MDERAVVAVDPGKTSGVAVCYPVRGEFSSWEKPCWDAVSVIEQGLDQLRIEFVVVEGFVVNAQSAKLTRGDDEKTHWPLETVGALRYLCTRQHDVGFRVQPRTDKRFGTDWKLRQLGWYSPSEGGHANDAARHMLKYLVDEKLMPRHWMRLLEEEPDGDN